ncbi:MAG TPA: NUDIX domain-containing protein [Pyrinomonadaceae bacterium]|nr:NUDIX domain-containing protein [Pyrinomonadaceae bacterium]
MNPMSHACVAITVDVQGTQKVLLAQKNLYLAPHGRYQFAAIARNGTQYVLPGGRVTDGESPAATAVRWLAESLGLHIDPARLEPLPLHRDDWIFFRARAPQAVDLDRINGALRESRNQSARYNNVILTPIEKAIEHLGVRAEHQSLEWVGAQALRAINAGFSREVIGAGANASDAPYREALAQLILS